MGITASTSKQLNYYMREVKDNSGIPTTYITATGNKKTSVANNIFNDTYTLDFTKSEAEINAKLLNFDDVVFQSGGSVGASGYKNVMVFGHPDKFIFDYAQDYNNCGIDSCLNILAMAGIKDVVEVTPEYEAYLGTPITKTYKKAVYNQETGIWETKEVTESTYPKRPVETEDSFLLWAVQNSQNDEEAYKTEYGQYYYDEISKKYYDSYVIHTKNMETYKKISDLQNNPSEVGGTYLWMQSNILNYWGVSHTVEMPDVVILAGKNRETSDSGEIEISLTETGKTDDKGNTIYSRTTEKTVITYSDNNKTVTTTVTTKTADVIKDGDTGYKEASGGNSETITKVTTETTLNKDFYYFANDFYNAILEGKGIILQGYANAFLGSKGGAHAITVVGVVTNNELDEEDQTIVKKVTLTDSTGTYTIEEVRAVDILGFYVIDTGGFLNPSKSSNAQFVTPERLYKFITDTTYTKTTESEILSGDGTSYGDYIVTTENIRKWADNLNLTGNDRKNILTGNDANNIIHGGDGNDVLYGGGGNDTLYGDNDKDTLYGGAGDDLLIGGKGDDLYVFQKDDGASHDTIVAGQGRDDIQFDHVVSEDLSFLNNNGSLVIQYGEDSTLTLQDYFKKNLYSSIYRLVEYTDETLKSYDFVNEILSGQKIQYNAVKNKSNKITGTKFVDEITGGDLNDTISAGDGNDILNGGAGNDVIKGGNGNDTITGSSGNDKLYGEAGENTMIYDLTVTGNDTIYSGKGSDYIKFKGINKEDLILTRQGNNLVITYNTDKGSSVTIANYFSKKGKTSVKYAETDNGYLELAHSVEYNDYILPAVNQEGNANVKINNGKSTQSETITGGNGFDTLYGGKSDDVISGGLGDDVIYGGDGNDTLEGGLGNDKLYGQNGDNTYVFNNYTNGNDTIYTSGKGKTTLEFSSLNFTNNGVENAYNDGFSYTKSGNDLIINYATELEDKDNSSVRISGFFKSKNEFALIDGTDTEYDLKNATIYFKGEADKKNKITGSAINDYIVGGDLNDTLKGGNGNDTIIAGLGNDNITGGSGHNEIRYAKGDGNDVINLTKGENCDIKLTGFSSESELTYKINKKDLVISYTGDDKKTYTLTLKNFGTKDVTNNATKKSENTSSVNLYLNDTLLYDLREGNYLPEYTAFTTKNYKYTGNWHSETIDATALNETFPSKNRGANINAGGGNDIIYGSKYNDTIKGGDGDDVIINGYGTDKVDGGNGNDTYKVFYYKNETARLENVTISDTGKNSGDVDVVEFNCSKDELQIWFNMDKNGKTDYKFNVSELVYNQGESEYLKTGSTATISGVEKLVASASDDLIYDYGSDALKEEIISFLGSTTHNYKDVNDVMKNGTQKEIEDLLAIFNNSDNWVQNV